MMRSLYFFLIAIAFGGCKNEVKNDCSVFQDTKKFSFLNDSISIILPSKLFKIKDTASHDFEINNKLLYTCVLSTEDSLSSVFINVENYSSYNMTNRDVVNNLKRLKNEQMSVISYDSKGYSFERYDTLNGKMLGEFIFEGKRGSHNVATGGVTFYYNKRRIEIIISLNEENFDKLEDRIKCVLSSRFSMNAE